VLVDRVQIQQVLLNLIRNAIEAMGGDSTRRLEVSSGEAKGGMIEVVVADSGPGLSEEIAAQLFQPFLSTKASGMGVGLSISRTIVEAHEGRIWAGPSPLGGTAFHFILPDASGEGKPRSNSSYTALQDDPVGNGARDPERKAVAVRLG
jgi:two-component system sensor kinase FixL